MRGTIHVAAGKLRPNENGSGKGIQLSTDLASALPVKVLSLKHTVYSRIPDFRPRISTEITHFR